MGDSKKSAAPVHDPAERAVDEFGAPDAVGRIGAYLDGYSAALTSANPAVDLVRWLTELRDDPPGLDPRERRERAAAVILGLAIMIAHQMGMVGSVSKVMTAGRLSLLVSATFDTPWRSQAGEGGDPGGDALDHLGRRLLAVGAEPPGTPTPGEPLLRALAALALGKVGPGPTAVQPSETARRRHERRLNDPQLRDQYLAMLTTYRDLATAHPAMIPALRAALRQSPVQAFPYRHELAEDWQLLRDDLDAYLAALETGEIAGRG